MHVAGLSLDLNWFLQLILTVFVVAVGLLHLVKNTASKYFEVDAGFEGDRPGRSSMPGALMDDLACVVCGNSGPKKCSRCKAVRYCSAKCQEVHWNSGHKNDCKVFQPGSLSSAQNGSSDSQVKTSGFVSKKFSGIALVPAHGTSKPVNIKQPKEILFPYDEFVKLFNWDKAGFPPCGLLNCGNSCFANVVLQCLTSTRPLVAYLLEKGHRTECIRSDWCFLCEFQTHIERASQSLQAFSPTNIISRLTNIGGNLGYGRQEDAHEFMRFAIDTMQSVCLDEFGGEKAVPPSSQETTLLQHIFGGQLQSQVICTKCENISNQYENMMDLTVEIHGEAGSLEECLDQFTVKEWLHGDNMYKCDGCNDYVKAWKRLTVKRPPNILTIALKRFQSGRFGKLNKRVTFPETLDLSPYMSDEGDGTDVYKLYAVVVHVDMLNASFFGHYICYIKDFAGNWYRLDDCKVARVDLEEVLSQGAYMLLYSRVKARPSCLKALEPPKEVQQMVNSEVDPRPQKQTKECSLHGESVAGPVSSNGSLCLEEASKTELPIHADSDAITKQRNHTDARILELSPYVASEAYRGGEDWETNSCQLSPSTSNGFGKVSPIEVDVGIVRDNRDSMDVTGYQSCQADVEKVSTCSDVDFSISDRQSREETVEDTNMVDCESSSLIIKDVEIYCNGHAEADESAMQVEEANELDSGLLSVSSVKSGAGFHGLKRGRDANFEGGNEIKSVDIMDDSSQ